jgi:hypothetical protein
MVGVEEDQFLKYVWMLNPNRYSVKKKNTTKIIPRRMASVIPPPKTKKRIIIKSRRNMEIGW